MPFLLLASSLPGPRCTAASQTLRSLQLLESLEINPFFWGEKAVMSLDGISLSYAHWPPRGIQVSWGEDGSEWPLFSWKEMTLSGHSQIWRGRKRHFVGCCVLE